MIVVDEYLAVRVVGGAWPDGLPDEEDLRLSASRHWRLLQRCTPPATASCRRSWPSSATPAATASATPSRRCSPSSTPGPCSTAPPPWRALRRRPAHRRDPGRRPRPRPQAVLRHAGQRWPPLVQRRGGSRHGVHVVARTVVRPSRGRPPRRGHTGYTACFGDSEPLRPSPSSSRRRAADPDRAIATPTRPRHLPRRGLHPRERPASWLAAAKTKRRRRCPWEPVVVLLPSWP